MTRKEELFLFDKMKKNDKKALDMLFRHYYAPLCNFALHIVKKAEIAEEVVADIFFILWRDRHRLGISCSVRAYLFKAVRNHALRTSKVQQPFFQQIEEIQGRITSDQTPESTYLYNELDKTYQSAFERLPSRCQLVFKLHKIDGLKYHEVSEVLEISIKTVENQMLKALRMIRAAVLEYDVERSQELG